ncbi:hypothetical protein AVEN_217724-1 [Araneus ventricosus]|uniref:Uncharacterized protein n=1 Tax=Araneus ventricosus TaxID=182803 RepID=A0A4Y2NLS8_ARAVE|nr:hypothetical protein AVEN_217724-1 [Araneus ventricosus]
MSEGRGFQESEPHVVLQFLGIPNFPNCWKFRSVSSMNSFFLAVENIVMGAGQAAYFQRGADCSKKDNIGEVELIFEHPTNLSIFVVLFFYSSEMGRFLFELCLHKA